jgi:hypothetical protein
MLDYRPDRSARMLCIFGLIAMLGAFLGFVVFMYAPAPWRIFRGGLSEVSDNSFERTFRWDVDVLNSLVGVGLAGLIFLVGGCGRFVVSKWRPRTNPH